MQVAQTELSLQYTSFELNFTQSTQKGPQGDTKAESLSLEVRYMEFTLQSSDYSEENTNAQSALYRVLEKSQEMKDFLTGLDKEGMLSLKDLGYEGKPILELTPEEATVLISDGGFFSVEETAKRSAEFVLSGAGDDPEMLKAGREGIVEGFKVAEKLWGGRLPEIAYETQKRTLELIDEKIRSLGANALDLAA